MTGIGDPRRLLEPPSADASGATTEPSGYEGLVGTATLAAIVISFIVGSVYLQGGFYPTDAFGVAVLSVLLVVGALRQARDRAAIALTVTIGGLAAWWLVRASTDGGAAAFLPLGASMLGFLAALLVVRTAHSRDRTRLSSAVVAIGAVSAAAGVAGELFRWSPLAEQTGGVWRVSTTLTYPAGAAVLFIVSLLVAMSLDLRSRLVRASLCLCLAGLIGTQSRWDLLALGAGALVVPLRRWPAAAWPLATGSLAGLVLIASRSGPRPTWWAALVVAAAVGAATVTRAPSRPPARSVIATGGVVLVAAFTVWLVVHVPVTRGSQLPTNENQVLAWGAEANQWRSSVLTGAAPPRVFNTRAPVLSYPGLAPNGYLTVVADGGLVGVLLLAASGVAVVAIVRRRDLLSSCSLAALVAFAVAGNVDFDWQLPALALLGGCVAGLATRAPGTVRELRPAAGPLWWGFRSVPAQLSAAWVVAVASIVTVQLVIGVIRDDTSALRVENAAPPPSPTPDAPARFILRGPDGSDPFMLQVHGRYYLYTSGEISHMNVPMRIGSKPGHWGRPVEVLPKLPAWATRGATWAPDVHQVAGGWALYFSAQLRSVTPTIHCIGAAFAKGPSGPFKPLATPFICQRDHRGSIDARTFVDSDNRLVLLWKSEDNANANLPGPDQNGKTGIYAQRLSANGRVLLGKPVKIFAPSQAWEGTIVEAPDMIQAWGTYWLFFSGNWFNSTSYGIGVAACQSAFGPCTDTDPQPFIGSNRQGSGPGEQSILQDGRNIYLLYDPWHAATVASRPVVMARLGFRSSGPYLASP